jgi:cob(I)alamin adenosyltransferase
MVEGTTCPAPRARDTVRLIGYAEVAITTGEREGPAMAAEDRTADEHREKMARVKAAKDRLYASKTREKGLLIVHTGTGKGKSTAAWGMVMRCLGHGLRVGVVQFVKGRRETGERKLLERFVPEA